MATNHAAAPDAHTLAALLHQHDDWKHLTVRTRGKSLVVVALDAGQADGEALARLELERGDQYGLAIMWHDDRWQRLPVSGTLAQVVQVLRQDFRALLASH